MEINMEHKITIEVLGVEIGTATGWDECDEMLAIQFYEANITKNIFDKEIPSNATFCMYLGSGIFQYFVGDDSFDVKINKEKFMSYL